MTLYDLSHQWRAIMEAIDEADGELTPETQLALDALQVDLPTKIESVCKVLALLDANENAKRTEAGRLMLAAHTDQRSQERLKGYLMDCLDAAGLKSYRTPLFRVSVCKNSQPRIEWIGEGPPPVEFTRVKTDLDKEAVRLRFVETGEAPVGFAVEYGRHVRIK